MIFATRDGGHIVVPWTAGLAMAIKHAKVFEHEGQKRLLVPNRHDEAMVCRNMGVDVPAPILTRYKWPGRRPPWDIQKTTAALLSTSKRCYVLSTMGTGKTSAAIYAMDYLMNQRAGRKALIVAPLSTLTPVWENEIFEVVPNRTVKVLYGSRQRRLDLLAEDADFYVINHHGLVSIQEALAKRGFDIVVVDELATFRNRSTNLWRAANIVINRKDRPVPYAWGLTGSPTPNAPTDAWAQLRLLTPGQTTTTMSAFQDNTMTKVSTFKWVPRPGANATVYAAMQPSVRFTRDDVMELPETTYVDRDVKLNKDAQTAYDLMVKKLQIRAASGETITAVNEAVLQGKLLQVSCGYIYTDGGTVYELDSTSRADAMMEIVDAAERKIIIFAPYIHALTGIAATLRKAGRKVGVIYGATGRGERNKIIDGFQHGDLFDTIVAHPQTMAHGLTLTAANTIVWWAPIQSLEHYEQANARITRPGQTAKSLIVHISGTPVERHVYKRLQNKGKMQGILLSMFKAQTMEGNMGRVQ